jgi:hypothetical protein
MQYAELVALNRCAQIGFSLLDGFLSFHDVFHFRHSLSEKGTSKEARAS